MGFDDGPGPLLLGRFQSFGGQAEPDGKPRFATNPLFQRVVGFHPSKLRWLAKITYPFRALACYDEAYAQRHGGCHQDEVRRS
jgi:hypothetical protein